MKKIANRMGLVFAVAAACLICCLIPFSSGQTSEVEVRTIATLAGIRPELERVQKGFSGSENRFAKSPSALGLVRSKSIVFVPFGMPVSM